MAIDTINQDGRERIVMDVADYEDLVDARDHAIAMRGVASGHAPLTSAELNEYLSAATPLAFWRRRAGKTQAQVAEAAGVSQPFLAQIESGSREGSVGVLARIAKVLRVRLEDLIAD